MNEMLKDIDEYFEVHNPFRPVNVFTESGNIKPFIFMPNIKDGEMTRPFVVLEEDEMVRPFVRHNGDKDEMVKSVLDSIL